MNDGKLTVRCKFISSPDAEWEQALFDEVGKLSASLPIRYSGNENDRTDVLFLLYLPYAHESLASGDEVQAIVSSANFPEDPYVALIACGPSEPVLEIQSVRMLCESTLADISRRYPYRHDGTDGLKTSVSQIVRVAVQNTEHLRTVDISRDTDDVDDLVAMMSSIVKLRNAS